MAKFPPIDLSGVITLLKSDGTSELSAALSGKLLTFDCTKRWHNILNILEKEIVPVLKEGGDLRRIVGPAKMLAHNAGVLASMLSQILSFVPGPVGILCSVINAIVCFCTMPFPMNIGSGMLELLGCIPGGKVAIKGGSKLAPKIGKLLAEMVNNSPELSRIVRESSEITNQVKKWTKSVSSKAKSNKKAKTSNISLGQRCVGENKRIIPYHPGHSGTMPSIEEAIKSNMETAQPMRRILKPTDYQYPISTNSMLYRLGTNIKK